MTPTYYLKDGKLYGPLDRMPPDKQQYCGLGGGAAYEKDLDAFNAHLSKQPLITHTFSGESRVIKEGEIEWKMKCDAVVDCDCKLVCSFHSYSSRRVATPKITEGGKDDECNCGQYIGHYQPECPVHGVLIGRIVDDFKNKQEIFIPNIPSPTPETGEKEKYVEALKKLLRIADCPESLIENPFIFGKPTAEDIEWANGVIQEHKSHQPHSPVQALTTDQEAAEKWISDHGVKFMAIEQQRNAFLAGCTHVRAQQGEELQQLRAWKKEAMAVMPDFQEIGKLIGVPLGQSVHDKIIPYLKAQQPVDAVAFAEWIMDNKYEWMFDSRRFDYRKWRAAWNNHSIHTTGELLTLFSSQTKQP